MENVAYIKIFPDGSLKYFFVERTKSPVAKSNQFFDNKNNSVFS